MSGTEHLLEFINAKVSLSNSPVNKFVTVIFANYGMSGYDGMYAMYTCMQYTLPGHFNCNITFIK